ncbi:MAG: glutamine synthetase type III, partial [Clostridia bacterium]|nr:glutamine synthetase type III [Clostridia bacterium]
TADKLEKMTKTQDFDLAVKSYTEKLLKKHHRIIFNYNGYGPEWEEEAARRGLLNHKNTADAAQEWFKKETVDLFVRQGVYTKNEVLARAKIQLENYVKTVQVEARTMVDMSIGQIYPAVSTYVSRLCQNLTMKKATFSSIPTASEEALIKDLATANEHMLAAAHALRDRLSDMPKDEREAALRTARIIVPAMETLRKYADDAEKLCAAEVWPFPNYYQLLYSVK